MRSCWRSNPISKRSSSKLKVLPPKYAATCGLCTSASSSAKARAPSPESVASLLKLLNPEAQGFIAKSIITTDRLRRDDAEKLGKAVAAMLDLKGFEESLKAQEAVPVEIERKLAWERIKDMIS